MAEPIELPPLHRLKAPPGTRREAGVWDGDTAERILAGWRLLTGVKAKSWQPCLGCERPFRSGDRIELLVDEDLGIPAFFQLCAPCQARYRKGHVPLQDRIRRAFLGLLPVTLKDGEAVLVLPVPRGSPQRG